MRQSETLKNKRKLSDEEWYLHTRKPCAMETAIKCNILRPVSRALEPVGPVV